MPVSLNDVVADCYPALNAEGIGDLEFWSTVALIRFAFDAATRLGRRVAVFTDHIGPWPVTGAGPIDTEDIPPGEGAIVLHAAANGAALREITVPELDAKGRAWRAATAALPANYFVAQTHLVGFYPAALSPWLLDLVIQRALPFEVTRPPAAPTANPAAQPRYGTARFGQNLYGLPGPLTGTYRYYYSFVDAAGEESNPSAASEDVTYSMVAGVVHVGVSPAFDVVARRIYRAGGAQTDIWWVGDIPNNTAPVFNDVVTDAQAAAFNRPMRLQPVMAPDVFQDFFRLEIIAGARGQDGNGAMPETASWLRSVTKLMEDVATVYWGGTKGL